MYLITLEDRLSVSSGTGSFHSYPVKKKGSILEISSKLPQLEFKGREHFRGNWIQMVVEVTSLGLGDSSP